MIDSISKYLRIAGCVMIAQRRLLIVYEVEDSSIRWMGEEGGERS